MNVLSDGSDSTGVKGSIWCMPCALLLGIGQVCVLPRCGCGWGGDGLVEFGLEVIAVGVSQHGGEEFFSHGGWLPFHCGVCDGA